MRCIESMPKWFDHLVHIIQVHANRELVIFCVVIFSQFPKTFVMTYLSTFIVHICSFFSSISIAKRE